MRAMLTIDRAWVSAAAVRALRVHNVGCVEMSRLCLPPPSCSSPRASAHMVGKHLDVAMWVTWIIH